MLALTFQVGADRVAVDVRRVREVVPRVRLTRPVGGPAWVAGVFVYRGRVVPVADLYRLAGAGECPLHLSSRIVLVPHPAGSDDLIGLLATQVADVRELSAAPATGLVTSFGLGVPIADGDRVIHLLDPDTLFAGDPANALAPRPAVAP